MKPIRSRLLDSVCTPKGGLNIDVDRTGNLSRVTLGRV